MACSVSDWRPPSSVHARRLTLSPLVDDEPTAHAEVLVGGEHVTAFVKHGESHAVRVSRQRLVAPEHVLVHVELDRVGAADLQPLLCHDGVVAAVNGRRSAKR